MKQKILTTLIALSAATTLTMTPAFASDNGPSAPPAPTSEAPSAPQFGYQVNGEGWSGQAGNAEFEAPDGYAFSEGENHALISQTLEGGGDGCATPCGALSWNFVGKFDAKNSAAAGGQSTQAGQPVVIGSQSLAGGSLTFSAGPTSGE